MTVVAHKAPLAGIKVLDLSRVLAGPFCTMILGDLGADVVKVERPGTGDDTRSWGPPFDHRGESAYYLAVNRNKRSIALDLRAERDRAVALKLISAADVVVENFLPGVLDRFSVSASQLLEEHQQLIWCTISGFSEAPSRPGYDFVVQAESGWMAITGDPDGDPMKVGIALVDILAAKDATIAIMAALIARARGHRVDRRIRVSLSESARAALVNVAQNALVSGKDAQRWGNAHANLVPYQLFHASDRPIVIAIGNDDQWRSSMMVLGLLTLARDAALDTNAGRLAHRDRIVAAIADAVSQRPAAEWILRLSETGVPCGVVKTVLEAIDDAAGASPLSGMPSSVGGLVRRPPPRLDEHGHAIRSMGWTAVD